MHPEAAGLLPIGFGDGGGVVHHVAPSPSCSRRPGYTNSGAMTSKGQESIFSGYANFPLAFGSLVGGPIGALIINEMMARRAALSPVGFAKRRGLAG